MASYPLLFKVGEIVIGDGFLARVSGRGRVLMTQEAEDSEWWVYGVEPGAIAQGDTTPLEATLRFNKALREILIDYADRAGSFDQFKTDVERFLTTADDVEAARWIEALHELRTGADVEDGFIAALKRLPINQAKCEFQVDLIRTDNLKVEMNAASATISLAQLSDAA